MFNFFIRELPKWGVKLASLKYKQLKDGSKLLTKIKTGVNHRTNTSKMPTCKNSIIKLKIDYLVINLP